MLVPRLPYTPGSLYLDGKNTCHASLNYGCAGILSRRNFLPTASVRSASFTNFIAGPLAKIRREFRHIRLPALISLKYTVISKFFVSISLVIRRSAESLNLCVQRDKFISLDNMIRQPHEPATALIKNWRLPHLLLRN